MPPLETPPVIRSTLQGLGTNPGVVGHPSPLYTQLALERLSPIELSYLGTQIVVDQPEVIVPLGWGEWDVVYPGEPIPPFARVVGQVAR